MRATTLSPLISLPNSSETQISHWWKNPASGFGHGSEYWHARRAFLNSYHLSERNGLKEKLRRSVKELNEAAAGLVSETGQKISKKKLGIKVFRLKFGISSLVLVRVSCFTPWLKKRDE